MGCPIKGRLKNFILVSDYNKDRGRLFPVFLINTPLKTFN